jgi:uncharacterized protein
MDQSISPGTTAQDMVVRPVSGAERIKSIDAIRGFALLGILMMNIPGFGINWDFWYGMMHGARAGKDYYTFAIVMVFFEGTMRGLFSMLFGAGMVLFMMNKKDVPGKPPVAEYYYRRLLWLVFFGLINAFVILWFGDILFFYGLCGMILFPFRKLNPKWLLVLGIACVSFGMIKQQWNWNETRTKREAYTEAVAVKKENKKLSAEQQGAIASWEQIEKNAGQKPDTAFTNDHLRRMRGDYITVFSHLIPINAGGEVQYMYEDPWDMLCMMFIGMALFGWGFFTNKLKTSTYAMWMFVGYGIGIPVAWLIFDKAWMNTMPFGDFVDRWRSTPQVFAEFRRIPITLGHASLLMLIYRSKLVPWLMKALSNVGQMAFTNYLMQSIICTFFFYGYGFGNYNKLRFYELYYVVFAVWIFQMIFSSIWLRYFRFGPFEWVWRSLTYWKKQPMRVQASAEKSE